MSEKKKRQSKLATDQQDARRVLQMHLQSLGLNDEVQYKEWCSQHGFSRTIHKSWKQLEREKLVVTRQAATVHLKSAKRKRNRAHDTIHEIFRGQMASDRQHRSPLSTIHWAYESTKHDRRLKSAVLKLILHVEPLTDFLQVEPAIPALGYERGNTYIEALVALAVHRFSWMRQPSEWRPRTHNTRKQFASLARHLLAEYEVPAFMDLVWFRGTTQQAHQRQEWFKLIGRGRNIRTADLPIPYTKRMAHYFLQAPHDSTTEAALRWGQIFALGGDARTAQAIIATRLGQDFKHDEFWTTVIRFFISNPMLDKALYGPILDYLHHQKFEPQEEFVRPGVIERRPPAQPHLCMKDRNPLTLVSQVERWHRRLAHEQQGRDLDWPRTGIAEFDYTEGREDSKNMKRWTIRELLSSRALMTEGRKMQHCVASYASSCLRRQTSIWTVEVSDFEGPRKLLTVEVNPHSKTICQARGKRNELPNENLTAILRRWAAQAGLRLAGHI